MSLRESLTILSAPESSEALDIIKKNNSLIDSLEQWSEKNPKIKSEQDYLNSLKIKSALCSLSCYCYNNSEKIGEETGVMIRSREDVYGKAMAKYNRSLLIKNKEKRIVAKYLLWNYEIFGVSRDKVLIQAIKDGSVRKIEDASGRVSFYVTGLHFKVGDNVFNHKNQRLYVETIGRQAIYVSMNNENKEKFISDNNDLVKNMQEIDQDTYHITYVGCNKGSVRNMSLTRLDTHYIVDNFKN